jgi:NTE family protein
MKPDLGLLTYLHGAGRTQAHKWLHTHRAAVGRRSSVDLKARFLAPEAFQKVDEQPASSASDAGSDEPERKSG